MISNYFVEVHPGEKLGNLILAKKKEIINYLGESIVDNPLKSKFLRDDPHFTLMCARTGDINAFAEELKKLGNKFSRINYEITDVEDNPSPGDLIEIRTVVKEEDRQKFKALHLAVMEASLPFNTAGIYERFEKGFEGEALENIKYCGFPGSRNLYKPHASLGRVHKDIRPSIEYLVNYSSFDPRGKYSSGDLILWALPFDKDDPTSTPKHFITINLGQ
jgi:hypothetical protein